MKRLILTLLWLWIPFATQAQLFEDAHFKEQASLALGHIYSLEFEEAQVLIQQLKNRYPDHPAPYFMLALNAWWKAWISEGDRSHHAYIFSQLSRAIELNKSYRKREAFQLEYTFFMYMNYAFKARLHALRGEYWKAAGVGRKALPHLKAGFRYAERSPEFYFSSGTYHYYAETYVDEHPIVKPLMIFFPDGDAKLGLSELEKAVAAPNFARYEAMHYLANIYLKEQRPAQALRISSELFQRFPANTFFMLLQGKTLLANGKDGEARNLFEGLIGGFEQISGYENRHVHSGLSSYTSELAMEAYHYLGLMAAAKQTYSQALSLLAKSDHTAGLAGLADHSLCASNALHRGKCYDSMGQREAALRAYRQALKLDDNAHVKKQAKTCLKAPCPY